ncbi:hypothetical protein FRC18_004288, partial [Serendipita sp. 400]
MAPLRVNAVAGEVDPEDLNMGAQRSSPSPDRLPISKVLNQGDIGPLVGISNDHIRCAILSSNLLEEMRSKKKMRNEER